MFASKGGLGLSKFVFSGLPRGWHSFSRLFHNKNVSSEFLTKLLKFVIGEILTQRYYPRPNISFAYKIPVSHTGILRLH